RADRAQDRKHLQANRFRRTLHVEVERGPVRIVGDGQVHPHRVQEVGEQVVADGVTPCGVAHGGQHGVGRVFVSGKELVGQLLQPCRPGAGGKGRVEIVEYVVGVTGKAVERVNWWALIGRQEPGGQKEGAAV